MVDLSRRIGGLFACALPILASFAQSPPSVARTSFDEEVTVVATTPSGGIGLPADKLPYNIQSVTADALENAQSLDLTDYLHSNLASVSINSAQGNPPHRCLGCRLALQSIKTAYVSTSLSVMR
jgi:hypothetical protein